MYNSLSESPVLLKKKNVLGQCWELGDENESFTMQYWGWGGSIG